MVAHGFSYESLSRAISQYCEPMLLRPGFTGQPVDTSHTGFIYKLKTMYDYTDAIVFSIHGEVPYVTAGYAWQLPSDGLDAWKIYKVPE